MNGGIKSFSVPRNPFPTVDVIIEVGGGIVLIERKNPPAGWALPGGFVEYGESAETAAIREAKEETGLDVKLIELLGVYSKPDRDPRFHTMSVVYIAEASGNPSGGDDALMAKVFSADNLPDKIAFDHRQIIDDYIKFKRTGKRSLPGLK